MTASAARGAARLAVRRGARLQGWQRASGQTRTSYSDQPVLVAGSTRIAGATPRGTVFDMTAHTFEDERPRPERDRSQVFRDLRRRNEQHASVTQAPAAERRRRVQRVLEVARERRFGQGA